MAGVAIVSLLAWDYLTGEYFHDTHYYEQHGWPKLGAFLLASALVWWLGPRTDSDEQVYVAGNEPIEPGRRPLLRPEDTLFFMSPRTWVWIFAALGVLFYFV